MEKTSTKEKRQWGVMFVRGMSAFQLFLGFCCIVIALVGLAAAFDAKQKMTVNGAMDIERRLAGFYRNLLTNVTNTAWNDRNTLIAYYRKEIRNRNPNATYGYRYYDYDYYDYPPSPKTPRYGRGVEIPDYRYQYLSFDYEALGDTVKGKGKECRLILDYLCVPAWIGIMYFITGLVGLRIMASKKKVEFLQLSYSFTLLNFLGVVVFAPGMIAVGILQWHFSQNNFFPYGRDVHFAFRILVGKITIGFAAVCLLASLALCIAGCCCPVSPGFQENRYKGLSESTETLAMEKQQDEDEDKILIA